MMARMMRTPLNCTLLLPSLLCFQQATGHGGIARRRWRHDSRAACRRVQPPFLMTVVYSLAFAVSSPVGVVDGGGVGVVDWTYDISMGFATGVFVYVAINHLMAKGYRPQQPSYLDTPLFKFLGVAAVAVVMIWD